MAQLQEFLGLGKRKTSVARVRLRPGTGTITVNKRPLKDYFGRETLTDVAQQPLTLTKTDGQYDAVVNLHGGGPNGQAEALRHGIARALLQVDPEFRGALKEAGYLTRDPRQVERKKYGQKKARKQFQFSKR